MSSPVYIAIYLLCLLAGATCCVLLLRGYSRSGTRLLLWTGICFGLLALNSMVVLFDIWIFPQLDLQAWRHTASLAAVSVLLIGLVWEAE